MLQRYAMRPLVDQGLEMAGLVIVNGIQQRDSSQLNPDGVRQELPSLLLRRVDPYLT